MGSYSPITSAGKHTHGRLQASIIHEARCAERRETTTAARKHRDTATQRRVNRPRTNTLQGAGGEGRGEGDERARREGRRGRRREERGEDGRRGEEERGEERRGEERSNTETRRRVNSPRTNALQGAGSGRPQCGHSIRALRGEMSSRLKFEMIGTLEMVRLRVEKPTWVIDESLKTKQSLLLRPEQRRNERSVPYISG